MKILISPDFGAGWSTWQNTPQQAKFALTYQPLIIALTASHLTEKERETSKKNALRLFEHDFVRLFDETPYIGSNAESLIVVEVEGKFRIHEYDGSEFITFFNEDIYYDSDKLA